MTMGNPSRWFQKAPLVIAHRGASAYLPENSMRAFELAAEMGADAIELDVRLTSNGVAVVHHDPVKRTTNQRISLVSHGDLDAPSLHSVLERFGGQILLNLELKVGSRALLQNLADLVQSFGLSQEVLISSFNPITIMRFRKIEKHLPVGLLLDRWSPGWLATIAQPDFLIVHRRSALLNRLIRRSETRIIVFTENEENRMRHFFDLGVAGLITDRPDLGRGVVQG
jgi:glycerophosphoryl diester phosphodiesterase